MIAAETYWIIYLIWCGLAGVIGYLLGNTKGQPVAGFWLGFLLGVIGWIIVACLGNRQATSSRSGETEAFYQHWQATHSSAALTRLAPTGPIRIRRGPDELGAWHMDYIRTYLRDGNLTLEDEYYDHQDRAWLPVAAMPWLS